MLAAFGSHLTPPLGINRGKYRYLDGSCSASHIGRRAAWHPSFYDLEQIRVEGPLTPAPLVIKPHAKQFPRSVVV